jgi:hypothetical protein
MTKFGNDLQNYAQSNSSKCQHPINEVDDNDFCHKCGTQLVSASPAIRIAELEAQVASLTAANETERKLNDAAFLDNMAALKKQAAEIARITAAVEDIEIYINNPSAWEHYDDDVSEKIRAIYNALKG